MSLAVFASTIAILGAPVAPTALLASSASGDAAPKQFRVPASITSDGSKNVSSALQSFIDGVPDGSTILFPSGSRYLLGGRGIGLVGRRNLTLAGNGATLRITGCDERGSAFYLGVGTANITLREFDIEGNNTRAGTSQAYRPGCEHAHGVLVAGARRVRINDVDVSRVFGDCLYVGIGTSGRWGTGIWYHHSTCEFNGRQAIAVVAGRWVLVEHVHFDGIGMNVLDIEPNSGLGGAQRIVFRNNTVGTYGHSSMYRGFFFAANGSHQAPVRRIVVRDNVVTGGTLATLVGDERTGYSGQRNRRRIVFVGNRSTVLARWGPVLTFKHADGIRLWRNHQRAENGPIVSFIDCTWVRRRR